VFLSQRRVYILPTRHGLTFGLAVILMLIGSINYNLSLGYVLTFLLAGLGIVSILHTFRNLAHLYVSAGRVAPVFAGTRRGSSSFSRTRAASIAIPSISPVAEPGRAAMRPRTSTARRRCP